MKFTIKTKLGLIFLVFLSTTIILGAIGIYSLMSINDKTVSVVHSWLPGVSVSKGIDTTASDFRVEVFKHISMPTLQQKQDIEQGMEKINQQMIAGLDAYSKIISESNATAEQRKSDQGGLDSIRSDWEKFQSNVKQVLILSRQGKQQQAMKLQADTCIPLVESIKGKVKKLVEFNQAGSDNIGKEVADTYNTSRTLVIAIIAVALLIGSCIIFRIGKDILTGIQQLLAASNEMAKGNLRVSSTIKTNDELGELANASNQMADNMRNLISQIQKTAEQVAASSQELTSNADQSAEVTQNIAKSIMNVSAMTTDQVDAVANATDHMENVAAGIEQSAAAIQVAAEKTKSAVDTAKHGTSTIDGAVTQMNNIEATVNQLSVVITKLGERSKEIGQIVDTISGIAGQTNLLALNAAIEAARAGEMGKGFAVVAEEVRKLAEQSQNAAKEIETLITEIQVDTEHAVNAMDKGTQEVKTGASVVQKAGTAFTKIYEMVDVVNQQAEEVAKTMEELATGTQNVVDSIQQIDSSSKNVAAESQSVSAATEEQSASMEQIAASSRSLSQMAIDLTQMSNRFKI